ncbi:leucine-rich repeat, immunoglobulin-like domain and transmembrane domain-containing protein 2 [Crotalus tigris]|uniref:leucine-rich repeat, immunoglobulin-like domain and transmembrane domain-containing protein 2 n=1 Tax=Crotalus tigris TaxID=88082 RepID=UPI00192F96FF|nr:leucine-rich repeat, immunoglobulin-like domain and transmembrane domain-containing protein 2 [Crotalus tigris]
MELTSHMFPLILLFYFSGIHLATSDCVTGCSCFNDTFGRSLFCVSTFLRKIPDEIPQDIKKIRIENSLLTELFRGTFANVSTLEYLWLNFNNITVMDLRSLEHLNELKELRIQGNRLRSVPWTAFRETPVLEILDLKCNEIDVLPEHALRYLSRLTYLDLSCNELTVISKEVFYNWPVYQKLQRLEKKAQTVSSTVLSLHDNPWICDCRLRGFVQFINSIGPPMVLINSYLTCSSPKSKAGKYFHEVELNSCRRPSVTSSKPNITVFLGRNSTLTCLVKANPFPKIWWNYPLKHLRGFNVSNTPLSEESFKSELVIPSAHLMDEGNYTCTAANFLGNASATTVLDILAPELATSSYSSSIVDEAAYIDVQIAKQTIYGVTLQWHTLTENPKETWHTLHFGKYEDAKKDTVYIGPGINTYAINDLLPATKYEVCVSLRKQVPPKSQCIVFVTGSDVSELEQREQMIHIIVVICGMVLAVPAGMYLCTSEASCNCKDKWASCCTKKWGTDIQSAHTKSKFDSLPGGSEEGLCRRDSSDDQMERKENKEKEKAKKQTAEGQSSADLY